MTWCQAVDGSLLTIYTHPAKLSIYMMSALTDATESVAIDQVSDDLKELPTYWRAAPRRWGHPIHSVCSYFATFPPQLAHYFVAWLTRPGDAIYDPFSGRGTVALEAAILGRSGHASDANPLAYVLSGAKSVIPTAAQLKRRLATLRDEYVERKVNIETEPSDIRMLYSDHTLSQLVFLKAELDREKVVDRFLMALVLGMLHANHGKNGASRGFSISMPNTFAMAPGYVRRYIAEKRLVRPDVDVFAMLEKRIERLDLPTRRSDTGRVWLQDATKRAPAWLRTNKVKLVLTSPPYLQVIKYGKYNWVRLWFLGEDGRSVDQKLMASASLTKYLDFMSTVCQQLAEVVKPDGYVCFVIGDVRRGDQNLNLAQAVWEGAIEPLGWHLHGIVADELPEKHKVSRIWKNNVGRATKTDRLLILSPTATPLPPLINPTWNRPTFAGTEGASA